MPAPLRTLDMIEAAPGGRVSALCPINSAARRISSPPRIGARAVRAPIGAGSFAGDGVRP
jgi:hypothetical protein